MSVQIKNALLNGYLVQNNGKLALASPVERTSNNKLYLQDNKSRWILKQELETGWWQITNNQWDFKNDDWPSSSPWPTGTVSMWDGSSEWYLDIDVNNQAAFVSNTANSYVTLTYVQTLTHDSRKRYGYHIIKSFKNENKCLKVDNDNTKYELRFGDCKKSKKDDTVWNPNEVWYLRDDSDDTF